MTGPIWPLGVAWRYPCGAVACVRRTPQGRRRGSRPVRPFPLHGAPSTIPHSPTCLPPSSLSYEILPPASREMQKAAEGEVLNLWLTHTHNTDTTKKTTEGTHTHHTHNTPTIDTQHTLQIHNTQTTHNARTHTHARTCFSTCPFLLKAWKRRPAPHTPPSIASSSPKLSTPLALQAPSCEHLLCWSFTS